MPTRSKLPYSVRELEYQTPLAHRLGYLGDEEFASLHPVCVETSKVLNGLIQAIQG